MGSRCTFWLPKKRRFCANTALCKSLFCGNHTTRSDGRWIPCPIDPSHSVLEANLGNHLKRCPLLKHNQSLSLQPFYQKGINGGHEIVEEDADDDRVGAQEDFGASSTSLDNIITSETKRRAVHSMSAPELLKLISKIKSIHASICNEIQDSFKIPDACGIWIHRQVDRKLPFQEKHVLQQASILGNLEQVGVFKSSNVGLEREKPNLDSKSLDFNDAPAVVEFGAGRGYLTQMLADCYGISKVFLVERKSYKLKADRSLRQKENLMLERLRIDIEDLNLNAVESLRGLPYLAIGKHLCGPATDMTLRCCIGERCKDLVAECTASCYLKGLAIATCCHHLCQWKHYINKSYLLNLGITKEHFHAITWLTSWAVDADHGSDLSGVVECSGSDIQITEHKEHRIDTDLFVVNDILRNMNSVERALVGMMCKDIIDAGRLMWMKEHGLQSQLVKYVPSNISPENHLLIAS